MVLCLLVSVVSAGGKEDDQLLSIQNQVYHHTVNSCVILVSYVKVMQFVSK